MPCPVCGSPEATDSSRDSVLTCRLLQQLCIIDKGLGVTAASAQKSFPAYRLVDSPGCRLLRMISVSGVRWRRMWFLEVAGLYSAEPLDQS